MFCTHSHRRLEVGTPTDTFPDIIEMSGSNTGPAPLGTPTNFKKWIDEARPSLLPPVGNRMMYNGSQFQVMIIGGPNQRDDFHVEKGEELFFQIEGDMVLDVMQDGKRVNLPIKEGEIFVLPVDVPHSPQRWENTIGLVIERVRRTGTEMDTLRWYEKGTNKIEYQEIFYCADLGTQIKECIIRYFGMKDAGKIEGEFGIADAEPKIHTPAPCSLQGNIDAAGTGAVTAHDYKSEFSYHIVKGAVTDEKLPCVPGGETFLWQMKGCSTVGGASMAEGDVMLLPIAATDDAPKVTAGGNDCVLLCVVNTEVV